MSTKDGFLKKKGRRGLSWKLRYFILSGGSLHYYKDQHDQNPTTTYNIQNAKIEFPASSEKKKNSLAITLPSQTEVLVFSAETFEKTKVWAEALEKAKSLPPTTAPERIIAKKKSALSASQASVTQKAAKSSIGKKVIREFTPEATLTLLDDFKRFVRESFGTEKERELEDSIYSLAIKTGMLYKNNHLSEESLTTARRPVLILWSYFLDCCEMKSLKDLDQIRRLLSNVYVSLDNLLRPHLSPRSMVRLREIFDFLSSNATMDAFFDDKNDDNMQKTAGLLRTLWDSELSTDDKQLLMEEQVALNEPTKGQYTDPGMFAP
eukprot:TRINITY_DN18622_c0_g1_i1.p1 TRINITY_DN18622_c0_g1~~TRINITY_DN18622_c0_g1_i1.p1  ORF type:complete len:321 (-),score=78.58 TRINITY_DN18622_c0_g1_i1:236-1198(-)